MKANDSVLVLDDEGVVRESLADYFEDCGWRVWQAASAEEALELLASESPGGVLVDIRLPGMRGMPSSGRPTAFIRRWPS